MNLRGWLESELGPVTSASNGEGLIHCRHHSPDNHPSCSVNLKKQVFHCFSCGASGTLRELAEYTQIEFPGNGHRKAETIYRYVSDGVVRFEKVRLQTDRSRKAFFLRRPSGDKGLGNESPILYHVDEVLSAIEAGKPVVWVEGEKDADRLRAAGFVATTSPFGAGDKPAKYAKIFPAGSTIILCGDADEPGQKYLDRITQVLALRGCQVFRVDLGYPIAKEHGKDVSDWLQKHSVAEFQAIVEATLSARKQDGLIERLIPMESERTVEIPARIWYVEGMITVGFNLVIAKKGIGKSFFIMDLGINVAAGTQFMGRETTKADVLYIPTELDRVAVHERLQIYEKLPPDLFVHYCWSTGEQALSDAERILTETSLRVLIFDMFLPVVPELETNAYESSGVFLRWRQLAQRCGAAIVAVWHSGKSARKDFMDSAIGTTGLIGQSDSILMLDRQRGETAGKLFVGGNHGKEQVLKVKFEDRRWKLLDNNSPDFLSVNDAALLKLVKERETTTPKIAAAATGRTYDYARMSLTRLYERGLIQKIGRGLYGPNNSEKTE